MIDQYDSVSYTPTRRTEETIQDTPQQILSLEDQIIVQYYNSIIVVSLLVSIRRPPHVLLSTDVAAPWRAPQRPP